MNSATFFTCLAVSACVLEIGNVSVPQQFYKEKQASYNKAYLALYTLEYQKDSLSRIKTFEAFFLKFSKDSSSFQAQKNYLYDSLMAFTPTPTSALGVKSIIPKLTSIGHTDFHYVIQKEHQNGTIVCYERVGARYYSYKESATEFNWKLLPNQKVITGYKCQLATTNYAGRIFNAWFTRQIPISDGPYKFCGLPGLIIELSDSKNHYKFNLVKIAGLNKPVAPKVPHIKNILSATKTEVRAGQNAVEASYLDRMSAMGEKITEEDKQKRLERQKKRNNPLELR